MPPSTSTVASATGQAAIPPKAVHAQPSSGIQPVHTPGLASGQANATFARIPTEQPHVIDMMKECYRVNGGGEVSDQLNSLIDSLAKKVEAGGGQKADEIKSMIVEMIKKIDPVPVDASPVKSATPAGASATPAGTSTTPAGVSATSTTALPVSPSATPQASSKVKGSWSWLGRCLSGGSKEAAILNNLQQVAIKEGVSGKLVQYRKELESVKREEALKQKIVETESQIEALTDPDSFTKSLKEADDSVTKLAKNTSEEKKGLMKSFRQADLSNRTQGKYVDDRRVQRSTIDALLSGKRNSPSSGVAIDPNYAKARKAATVWYNKTVDQRAKHDAAVPRYEALQSQFAESVEHSVIPVLEPEVELNAAKLEALAAKITELEKLENGKLPDLRTQREAANKKGDTDEINKLKGQISACEKNIENFKEQAERITELQRSVSAAATDLSAIRELNLQFGVRRSKANVLPFSLQMLGNGVESKSINQGFSLNEALKYGGSGRSNGAFSRAIALRTHLAEFGSSFNNYESPANPTFDTISGHRRSFLSDLGGALSSPASPRTEKVLDFLSTQEGRNYVHRLAACNVTAAGFNAKTLQLDAPSLAYKVESGFSSLKKLMIGRIGVYARDPVEYLGKRLSILSRLSSTLQRELFRDGKPVSIEHTILTPRHAVEAASLILAALPNDLLTTNHVEVTRFMKSLREFESETQSAEEKKEPVDARKLLSFKEVLREFHNTAAEWVSKRDLSGADKSVEVARQISTEIASNGRKGFLRRATVSVGNFVNLAGGRAIREGFSSLQTYLSRINQKERLRQQFQRPDNIALIAGLKRQLLPLTKSKNESDVNNAKALLSYLSGESLMVEMKGELSPQIKETLVATGIFLQKAWEPLSKGRSVPKVIGLSSLHIHSIPNYSKTSLSKFVADASSEVPVKPLAPASKPLNAPPAKATASTPPVGRRLAESDNQWIYNIWGQVFNEEGNRGYQLANLKDEYQQAFLVDYPGSNSVFSDLQVEAHHKNLASLEEIAAFAGQNVQNIPASTLEKMRELMPTLLKVRRGAILQGQLAPLTTRSLQDVSPDQLRCWLRSSWGAAVNALSKDEFVRRVGSVAQSMANQLGKRNLTPNEIGQIYDQIKADPLNGSKESPVLEYKQRALMIALMDQADGSWRKGNTLKTLNELKNGGNPQTEGDFGILFFKALGLPVIIHDGADQIPDVYLPENYKTDQHGHPDTWPTLRYDGTGMNGHWQFYEKPTRV